MSLNKLEKDLQQKIQQSKDMDFPSLQVQAYFKGKKRVDISRGPEKKYFDLASLTKILFTGLWFSEAIANRKLNFNSKVCGILPWFPHKTIQVGQLLSHSAGNAWWQPFYKEISLSLNPEQAWQQMEHFCRQAPLSKSKKAVYSDLDYYLLGSIMQKIEQKPLIEIWNEFSAKHYSKSNLHFNYKNKAQYSKDFYAPTEKCVWRKRVLKAEVHDENAWALGGVASHAGLFGNASDLSLLGKKLRSILQNTSQHSKVLKKMVTRSMSSTLGDWGYGFMLPSRQNSSAGELFSKKSFGHTGFTGISFWLDPEKDLFVSIVSNRVHTTRENKGFIRLRPKIHNWIAESIQ